MLFCYHKKEECTVGFAAAICKPTTTQYTYSFALSKLKWLNKMHLSHSLLKLKLPIIKQITKGRV